MRLHVRADRMVTKKNVPQGSIAIKPNTQVAEKRFISPPFLCVLHLLKAWAFLRQISCAAEHGGPQDRRDAGALAINLQLQLACRAWPTAHVRTTRECRRAIAAATCCDRQSVGLQLCSLALR